MSSCEVCPHVLTVEEYTVRELEQWRSNETCFDCRYQGPKLWLCLTKDCGKIYCADSPFDHSTAHYENNKVHCVQQNLFSLRLWCYICESEVFLSPQQQTKSIPLHNEDNDSSDSDDFQEPRRPKGLQNIGNTCYMNAALQALCNTQPLSQYFLQCCFLNSNQDRKTCLSRNFKRLVQEMYQKNGLGYIVPSGILYGIRSVHPMFRGYQQHDTQEFLRCFMDQLHEELKEPVPDSIYQRTSNSLVSRLLSSEPLDDNDDDEDDETLELPDDHGDVEGGASSGSQSEAEYETCDSGVSERSSLSDESERISMKRKHSASYPSPRSKRGYKSPPPPKTRKKPVKHRSIISDIFDGKLLSSVQCLTCNKVSTRVETFQDLSLPIPSRDHVTMLHQGTIAPQNMATCSDVYNAGKPGWVSWIWEWMRSWFWGPTISLHDCLAAFFSADELKGDNMYSCEKCSKLRNGVKYSKVLELPEVLCIHLKRFRHELAFSSKIGSYVGFPLTDLDMRPYLHKDCTSQVTTYDLSSIICHHGTAGGGHYTSYILSPLTNEWYEMDDQCCTQVSHETVANAEAYVLFYRKNNGKIKKVQGKALEMMRCTKNEQALMQFYVSKEWINRFNTFAEPGPIDNSDFLCAHGGVDVHKIHTVEKMTTILNQNVWQFLYDTFGGGPACNRLYLCGICQQEQEAVRRRKQHELTQYLKYNQEFQDEESPPVIYGLSMLWFRQWQTFVQGTANEPPGPIDNTPIVTSVNGVKTLKPGSDYGQLSEELWTFFKNIYGGGPELILKQQRSRASFSSGVSSDKDSTLSQQTNKAKSVESLSGAATPVQRRVGRTQSTSSDNIAHKSVNTHRKQQSLGNCKTDKIRNEDDLNTKIVPYYQTQSSTIEENNNNNNNNSNEKSLHEEVFKPVSNPDCELDVEPENDYCPTLTPDEFYNYHPLKKCSDKE